MDLFNIIKETEFYKKISEFKSFSIIRYTSIFIIALLVVIIDILCDKRINNKYIFIPLFVLISSIIVLIFIVWYMDILTKDKREELSHNIKNKKITLGSIIKEILINIIVVYLMTYFIVFLFRTFLFNDLKNDNPNIDNIIKFGVPLFFTIIDVYYHLKDNIKLYKNNKKSKK